MAWRLRLAPEKTNIDFFRAQWITFGGSIALMFLAFFFWGTMGLNYGIDFKGGTTLRTESTLAVDVGNYRTAMAGQELGDVVITEVFDPSFRADQHVAMIRLSSLEGSEAVTPEVLASAEAALKKMDPAIKFVSVESVGPKVSGELVYTSVLAVTVTSILIMLYIWLRFEWQFAVGGVLALLHDVFITVGIFALFQLKFDLSIVAALLTILGYSINDTVVVFDRLRENLEIQNHAAARCDEPVGQRNPKPDADDICDHTDRRRLDDGVWRRRDPGLFVCNLHRSGSWHLFVGLCRQKHRADDRAGSQ